MAGKEVEYITAPNDLRKKQKMAGVTMTLDAGWVDAAERSIATAKFDYMEAANEDLAKLQQAYETAVKDPANRVEHIQALYGLVQSIKGQGSSFGFPLMSAVGNQLARFIEETGDDLTDAQLEVMKVHVEALRLGPLAKHVDQRRGVDRPVGDDEDPVRRVLHLEVIRLHRGAPWLGSCRAYTRAPGRRFGCGWARRL